MNRQERQGRQDRQAGEFKIEFFLAFLSLSAFLAVKFPTMHRREFLFASAALLARCAFARDIPRDVKIVRITAFDIASKRPKFVGKNARLDDHGDGSRDRVVILHAGDGSQGIGCCRASEKDLSSLLNKNPADLFDPATARTKSPLGVHTMPLWDLLGKLANQPVYKLLNDSPSPDATVSVYDGSIYFSDLIPAYADKWQDRFKWELDELFSRGHRAFKAKIGRGSKWMPRDEGDARDIEVLKVLRAHAGKDVSIAVDANNGYGPERTRKLLDALPDYNFAFVEEMFPEEIEADLELKKFLRERKLKTLVADGETQPNVAALKPFMEKGALDLYQLDVNGVGVEGLMEEAALCRPTGGALAPHSWGTLLGFYAQLHVARAIPNFFSGEQDPLHSDALIAEGYAIKDGRITVPDAPGFGLRLDPDKMSNLKPVFELNS
jgi:L-alanine-DL-glutamate epimerase-like enolase superfamily enzyme